MTTNRILKPLNVAQRQALVGSLNPARVATRQGGRTKLSYLEAWDVKATLIKVFGFGGFSAEVVNSEMLFREQIASKSEPSKLNWKVTFKARVQLTIHQTGAIYTEDAIADSSQPDFTEAADMAMKSAESDALKRCAIYLGTQFGLSLYNKGATVDVVQRVLMPGQEWPPTPEQQVEWGEWLAEQAEAQTELNARNQQSVQNAQAVNPSQQPVQGGPTPVPQHIPNPNLTPAQSAANQALLERALSMRAERDAAMEAPEEGQAAALES